MNLIATAVVDMTQMRRVETGALRIYSAQRGEASRLMRLAMVAVGVWSASALPASKA